MLNILQIHCNHTIEFEFSTFKIDNNILFIFMDTFWEKNIFQSKLSNLKDWHLCQKLPQICAFAQQWYRMGRSAQAPLPRKWDGVGWLKILGCQLPYRDRERGGDGAERSFTSAKFTIPMLARASKKLQPALNWRLFPFHLHLSARATIYFFALFLPLTYYIKFLVPSLRATIHSSQDVFALFLPLTYYLLFKQEHRGTWVNVNILQ